MTEEIKPEVGTPKDQPKPEPFDRLKYVNKSCKHCYGTGVYGKLIQKDSDPMPIMCSCIQKNMNKAMARGEMPMGVPGMGRFMRNPEQMKKMMEDRKKQMESAEEAPKGEPNADVTAK